MKKGDFNNNAQPIKPGQYKSIVKEVKITTSNTGSKLLRLTWEILEGSYKRKTFQNQFSYENPAVAPIMNILLGHLGFDDDEEFEFEDLEGRCCIVDIQSTDKPFVRAQFLAIQQ